MPNREVLGEWANSTADAALVQIRERGNARLFRGTSAEHDVVLAGIAHDPKSKKHRWVIERG